MAPFTKGRRPLFQKAERIFGWHRKRIATADIDGDPRSERTLKEQESIRNDESE
jgi:hypothetical protein